MEFLKQFQGIIFGYEIKLFSDHKNLGYVATLSESKRVMRWRLILKEFGPKIQYISGIDKIVADTLGRLPYTPGNNNKPCTRKAQCRANKLFAIGREENNECFPPLNLLIVQTEQQNELRNIKSNLRTYISD